MMILDCLHVHLFFLVLSALVNPFRNLMFGLTASQVNLHRQPMLPKLRCIKLMCAKKCKFLLKCNTMNNDHCVSFICNRVFALSFLLSQCCYICTFTDFYFFYNHPEGGFRFPYEMMDAFLYTMTPTVAHS